MSEKLSFSPLIYALIQVVFNPLLHLASSVPDMQEQMRQAGYPDFALRQAPNIILPSQNSPQAIEMQQQWTFADILKHNGYVLSPNVLVFHTTGYQTFALFLESAMKGIDIVGKIVPIDYIERIGIRYINVVSPQAEERVAEYLNEGIRGLMAEDEKGFLWATSESQQNVGEGVLTVKTLLGSKLLPYIMPADLLPLNLVPVNETLQEAPRTRALVDIDFHIEKRFVFNAEELKTRLTFAHVETEKAFHLAVTEHAINVWR